MLTTTSLITLLTAVVLFGLVLRYQSLFNRYTEKALLGLFAFSLIARPLFSIAFENFVPVGDAKTQLIIETLSVGGLLIAIFGVAVIAVILWSQRFNVSLYQYEAVIGLFGLYNLVTAVIGLAMGNDLSHLLSDTYKLIVFPLGYLAVLIIVDKHRIYQWYRAVYILFAVSSLAILVKQIVSLANGSLTEFSAGTGVLYVVPLLLITLSTPESENPLPVSQITQFGLLFLTIASIFLSLGRGDWIVTICVIVTFLFTTNRQLYMTRLPRTVPGALMSSGLIVLLVARGQSILARVNREMGGVRRDITMLEDFFAYERRARGSLAQKIAEALDVLKHMVEHGSVLHYLFGFGNGAQYQTVISKVSSGGPSIYGGLNHQIHNFLFAQLFRRGLVGVVLGVWLFLPAILTYFRAWKRAGPDARALYGAVFLTLVAVFIKMMSISATFYHVRFIIFFGLSGVLLRTGNWDQTTNEKSKSTTTE